MWSVTATPSGAPCGTSLSGSMRIGIEQVTVEQARMARQAFVLFGKGQHSTAGRLLAMSEKTAGSRDRHTRGSTQSPLAETARLPPRHCLTQRLRDPSSRNPALKQ